MCKLKRTDGEENFVAGRYLRRYTMRPSGCCTSIITNGIRSTLNLRRLVAFKKKMYSKWKRSFPMLKKRLPTFLELRSWRHRKIAVRWHLGSFPRDYRYLSKIGLQGQLDELKVLSGSKGSRGVNFRIGAALAGITAIDERKYGDRGVT